MKSKLIGILGAAAILVLVLAAFTQGQPAPPQTRTIAVTGSADVRVVPNQVVLTLGVETWDPNLETAKTKNDTIVRQVLSLATMEYGIPPEHVQTDYIGVEPRYQNKDYGQGDLIGYFVHKSIVITLDDLSLFEGLLSSALHAGVNYVQGIEFRTTDLRTYRDQARSLAIQAAKEKAAAMAGELGQKVGLPQTIEEQQNAWWSGYSSWWGARWGSAMTQNTVQEFNGAPLSTDTSVAPGQISVTASVSVTFELTG